MRFLRRFPLIVAALAFTLTATAAESSGVGQRFPSEKRMMTDKVTGLPITVLTTDPANDAKPYQTHTTWTADGQWIIFRSDRGGSGSQAFIVNEKSGDILQLTAGPRTGTGSLNLGHKSMRLFYMRGGPAFGPRAAEEPALPRELVELDLAKLIPDAMAGTVKEASAYERVVCVLPAELRDSGGFALDADESCAYWGVTWGPPPARPAPTHANRTSDGRSQVDSKNTDPKEERAAARERFANAGKGPGGIRRIDLKTGEITKVIDLDIRMGHVQTNLWVPGEIIYCHETTGDAPQRMWTVRGDGTGNRPLYVETPDEWVTHETVAGPDEVMFNIMGHLPYLREHPTGVAVINLRTNAMKLLGQVEENMGQGRLGGFWHCNGSPDGRWAVADNFSGNVTLIDRRNGQQRLLTTDHKMRPDHTHPIFSPDSKRVAIQSGQLTDGKSLDLMVIDIPAGW
ncbi:TolB family protein [Opitutus terrae]|uniref:WD40 domain protein beta Propeller n=1 Tax=Opitutus terrae (strain DSM 11246 / JCM 15787 / PB90-1) TaxID=452637 RepID=B1ZRC9_OPITP|nr:PD40 domain-containing protein [Opitutus terrae]ACB74616.1 WD40 domain protein beta Propeller [Opitutus terrae PB90-1]